MDRLLAPPDFPLAEAHASAITTLGMALFYLPALPLSPFLATVGEGSWWRALETTLKRPPFQRRNIAPCSTGPGSI